ncbi:hypothetical protein QTO34_004887 [Cnephaeus nilssonii]|uniref:Uncharacterized protein n=1 Tax=Cnephaeus nilssonii TaxID=3371016 RepID=A0AA40HQ81_CNENI|nr:hypothetical protein QTO34_004887 [Eptesicus nilssonii]
MGSRTGGGGRARTGGGWAQALTKHLWVRSQVLRRRRHRPAAASQADDSTSGGPPAGGGQAPRRTSTYHVFPPVGQASGCGLEEPGHWRFGDAAQGGRGRHSQEKRLTPARNPEGPCSATEDRQVRTDQQTLALPHLAVCLEAHCGTKVRSRLVPVLAAGGSLSQEDLAAALGSLPFTLRNEWVRMSSHAVASAFKETKTPVEPEVATHGTRVALTAAAPPLEKVCAGLT